MNYDYNSIVRLAEAYPAPGAYRLSLGPGGKRLGHAERKTGRVIFVPVYMRAAYPFLGRSMFYKQRYFKGPRP